MKGRAGPSTPHQWRTRPPRRLHGAGPGSNRAKNNTSGWTSTEHPRPGTGPAPPGVPLAVRLPQQQDLPLLSTPTSSLCERSTPVRIEGRALPAARPRLARGVAFSDNTRWRRIGVGQPLAVQQDSRAQPGCHRPRGGVPVVGGGRRRDPCSTTILNRMWGRSTPSRMNPHRAATCWEATLSGPQVSSSRATARSSKAQRASSRTVRVATPRPRACPASKYPTAARPSPVLTS